MAVMDFREGGVGFTLSRQRARRDHGFEERGWHDSPVAQNGYSDTPRYAADPAAEGLGARIARLTHYFGAIISVGLMVGLLVWGWQLVMRDVSGIPVIKAIAGDARTAPDEPGGELTSYTGYAVNDVAGGSASRPAAELAIAPAATGLSDGDVAMGQLGATAHEPAVASEAPVSFGDDRPLAMTDAESRAAEEAARLAAEQARIEMQTAMADAAATASDVPAQDDAVTAAVVDETGQPVQADAINDALAQAQAGEGALAASARPAPRPRRAAAAAAPATEPTRVASAATETATDAAPAARPAEVAAAEPAPAAAPAAAPSSGTPMAQIGAFDSDAIAQSEWGRLSGKFGNLFSGKGQVIQKHQANGRTFWRLRVAGFDSRADAQRFCAALIAGGTDCIPATAQ